MTAGDEMIKLALIAGCGLILALGAGTLWAVLAPGARLLGLVAAVERGRAGLTPKTAHIPEFGIAYLEGGAGETLLLVHGSSGDKDNWNRVARHLTPHLRVVAVDLPGFGDSDKPDHADYGLQAQVGHIRAFAAQLDLTRFHLGGHSMGGRIAAMYAARYPEQVQSLWLLAPGGVLSSAASDLALGLARGEANPLFARSDADFDRYLAILVAQPPALPAPLKRAYAERAARRADLHERIFDVMQRENLPLEAAIGARLDIPTRLVWGDRDRVWHASGAAILQQHMPRASLLALPDIGHVPLMEAPQRVAEDYLAFLQTLPRPAPQAIAERSAAE